MQLTRFTFYVSHSTPQPECVNRTYDLAMTHKLLADLVVVLHFLFIVFAIFGGVLALRWRWIPWLHLPCVAWGAAVELTGRVCPLTPLENSLRAAGGAAGYPGGFIEHYLLAAIYPAGLTRGIQLVLAGILLCLNAAVYFFVWRRALRNTGQ